MINIVLIEPEIPQNAGNIMRTCAATGSKLFLVKPLGFDMSDKYYKRAGLDYHELANVEVMESFEELYEKNKDHTFYFASTKSPQNYTEVSYDDGCFIVFGKESYGIKESILKAHYDHCVRIPMRENIRSLNLATSVGIVLFEGLRQQGFSGLESQGHLTGRKED